MAVYQKVISVTTANGRPDFVDITDEVRDIIKASHIQNGSVVCQTPHTTCSVIFEEYVHDLNYFGQEFLQSDLIRILDGLVPRETEENRSYRYPGPMHLAAIAKYHEEHPEFPKEPHTMLNDELHSLGVLRPLWLRMLHLLWANSVTSILSTGIKTASARARFASA